MRNQKKILQDALATTALWAVAISAAHACGDASCEHVKDAGNKISAAGEGAAASTVANSVGTRKIQEGFNQVSALQQMGEMKVVVADLNEPGLEKKLSKEIIKAIIANGLAGSQYKICDESSDCCSSMEKGAGGAKGCDMATLPILYLKLKTQTITESPKVSAFSLNLSLVEKVKVARNGAEAMVAVWTRADSGKIERDNTDPVVQQIAQAMGNFRSDLDQANPQKSASK